ncbi:dehydrogenase with different specificitie [Microthyrium microscopicum]|uniref:Dehydrogenase with different specificitie n=1 Tax=Microthyrium microscopicum TaxID=703497 RepID=A0A6A6U541_9PEZI|nr:dehydrogenase with different specificitie [Microthyrium microscopicum]
MASSNSKSPVSRGLRVAIVTGASRGIGAAIALELAKRGYNVTIVYSSPSSESAAKDLVTQIESLGVKAILAREDLYDTEAPDRIVKATTAAFGPHVDILVNNAATEVNKRLGNITLEDISKVYDLNVRAAILMSQAVLPYLRSPGRIINMSSVGGRCGFQELSLYCSSKAALEGLTRCWAAELGKDGHTVNAVSPGPVQTQLLDKIPPEIVAAQKAATPVENRLGTVDDIALIVAWLASEEARWVSGQVLSASGGLNMY